MASKDFINNSESFKLHEAVWNGDLVLLKTLLSEENVDLEARDPRGRTALLLAVTLGNLEAARMLLNAGADANADTRHCWGVTHEATVTGDPDLLRLALQHREYQRHQRKMAAIFGLLEKLKETPDFYLEMKWEFTSWVPLVSRVCPSDTYKIYKQGTNIRIDTTLVSFEQTSWVRGDRSYIFKSEGAGGAVIQEIDHDRKMVHCERFDAATEVHNLATFAPHPETISQRLTSPIATTYIDVDKIEFERSKSGIWGWRSDKNESISGYDCKVFTASNVTLVTRTRKEHLSTEDKKSSDGDANPIDSLFKFVSSETKSSNPSSSGASDVTCEEYFDPDVSLGAGRDIGRPKEESVRSQSFKAALWLSDNFPLSFTEQVTPIIDLMASSNAHFARLKNFIELQLPAGFPIKIEIPLFHVLNACITFGNVFALDEPVEHVSVVGDPDDMTTLSCVIDDEVFEIPGPYTIRSPSLDSPRFVPTQNEDDMLLQFAIQQSLLEADGLPPPYSAVGGHDLLLGEEDAMMQRAINESLGLASPVPVTDASTDFLNSLSRDESFGGGNSSSPMESEQLRLVMELSEKEERERLEALRQEEEELAKILALSLDEK